MCSRGREAATGLCRSDRTSCSNRVRAWSRPAAGMAAEGSKVEEGESMKRAPWTGKWATIDPTDPAGAAKVSAAYICVCRLVFVTHACLRAGYAMVAVANSNSLSGKLSSGTHLLIQASPRQRERSGLCAFQVRPSRHLALPAPRGFTSTLVRTPTRYTDTSDTHSLESRSQMADIPDGDVLVHAGVVVQAPPVLFCLRQAAQAPPVLYCWQAAHRCVRACAQVTSRTLAPRRRSSTLRSG